MRITYLSFIAAGLLTLGACGSDSATDTPDLGGVADGGSTDSSVRDGSQGDASEPPPDAGLPDTGGSIDATVIPDAASDAGDAGPTTCDAGFELVSGACVDINECDRETDTCDALVTCNNTSGSFTCGACPFGYEVEGATGCTDINECEAETPACSMTQLCTNTPGSFTCGDCPTGYMGGDVCVDIDECMMDACSELVTCDNTDGSYTCGACPEGYAGDGGTCDDIDECADVTNPCGDGGTCNNVDGSYECTCATGFELTGGVCVDINECDASPSVCGPNTTCTNTPGSYECPCSDGFDLVGDVCENINECTETPAICGDNATCEDTDGSYECTCDTGYGLTDGACVDIDECTTGDFTCSTGRVCRNTVASYECVTGMATVFAGPSHACAVTPDRNIYCWGNNENGQLGYGDAVSRGLTEGSIEALGRVDVGTGWQPISAALGDNFSCILSRNAAGTNFSARCFGNTLYGVLGNGSGANNKIGDSPTETGGAAPTLNFGTGRTPRAIVAGTNHGCAALDNGAVKCWGRNHLGQLGIGNTNTIGDSSAAELRDAPFVDLGTGFFAVAVAAGTNHSCALSNDNRVKCWGANDAGQLGQGSTVALGDAGGEMGDVLSDINLGTGFTPVAITAGAAHTCALSDTGAVKCWGSNASGQLGRDASGANIGDELNEMGNFLEAIDLGDFVVSQIDAGDAFTCVRSSAGESVCWGDNSRGQLGIASTAAQDMASPQLVTQGDFAATFITAGASFACSVYGSPGGVRCWGANDSGQAGIVGEATYCDEEDETVGALSILPFSTAL